MIEEKKIIVYVAPDGKQFQSEDEAWRYCAWLELDEFFEPLTRTVERDEIAEHICNNWETFVEIIKRHS